MFLAATAIVGTFAWHADISIAAADPDISPASIQIFLILNQPSLST
jgi:hypothetical protein